MFSRKNAALKKVKKSMPKWIPKWMKNHSEIDAGVALGDFLVDFKDFGEWPKKADFLMPLERSKNP